MLEELVLLLEEELLLDELKLELLLDEVELKETPQLELLLELDSSL